MADEAIIYVDGHRGFKINLAHSPSTVMELIKQAKMLIPNDPNSVAVLEAYREARRAS